MRKVAFFVLFSLLTIGLMACPTRPGGGGDDDDAGTDDDDAGDDDDATDDDDAADPETDCGDGEDNDGDGAVDCDDSDCAAEDLCVWPDAIDQRTDVEFTGFEIECGEFPLEFDYQMPNCADRYTSTMARRTDGNLCPTCDLTFEGPYTPVVKGGEDTCTDLLDQPAPTEGAFGIIFTSATQWTIWTEDGNTGEWSEVGVAEDDGAGNFLFTSSSVLNEAIDTDIVDCRQQDIGTLDVTLSFSEAAKTDG